jgi:hypothetical protein
MASDIRRENGAEEAPHGAFQDKVEFKGSALYTSTAFGAGLCLMPEAYATQPQIKVIYIFTYCSICLHIAENRSEILGIDFEAKFD